MRRKGVYQFALDSEVEEINKVKVTRFNYLNFNCFYKEIPITISASDDAVHARQIK